MPFCSNGVWSNRLLSANMLHQSYSFWMPLLYSEVQVTVQYPVELLYDRGCQTECILRAFTYAYICGQCRLWIIMINCSRLFQGAASMLHSIVYSMSIRRRLWAYTKRNAAEIRYSYNCVTTHFFHSVTLIICATMFRTISLYWRMPIFYYSYLVSICCNNFTIKLPTFLKK